MTLSTLEIEPECQSLVDVFAQFVTQVQIGDALGQYKCIGQSKGAASKALGYGFAVEPLHSKEALALGSLTVGHMGNDAGVSELREDLCLAGEALTIAAVSSWTVQELECDKVSGELITRTVDGAHAAGARDGIDLEAMGEILSWA